LGARRRACRALRQSRKGEGEHAAHFRAPDRHAGRARRGECRQAWGVGTVSSSLHGIPVSFSGTVTDLTTHTVLDSFFQAKGHGNGMHNQPTITCTAPPETATAGELGIPGVNPNDLIEFDLSVQVVLKP
jgi:hypothetical protein